MDNPAYQPLDGSESVSELIRRLSPMVTATVRSFGLDDSRVADVTQDVWVLFLRFAPTIRHPRAIPSWLRTTAARQALRTANRGRRELPFDPAEADLEISTDADDAARWCRDRTLWHAVNRMPARDQYLIRLVAQEPWLTTAEIAMRLGVAPESVRQLRSRCLRKLRRRLLEAGITGPGL